MSAKQANKSSRTLRLRLLSSAMGFALLFNAGQSQAILGIGDIVFDPTQFGQMLADYSLKLEELGETYAHYAKQVQSMQDMLTQVQALGANFGLGAGPQMEKVAENYMVPEKCGGFSLSALTQVFNPNGKGDIYAQQKQVCASIQRMENIKYNATVDYLTSYATNANNLMDQVRSRRNASTKPGEISGVLYDMEAAKGKMEKDHRDYETRMTIYNAYVASMKNTQRNLAQMALKGSRTSTVLGQIGKTAILEAALSD